jgi:PqqD family protein of HPr-rel-A system
VRFLLKEYAPEAVAFDTASGDTHYLAPLALAAFKLFVEQPALSLDAAREALLPQPPAGPAPTRVAVDETLDGLRRVGLVHSE